MRLEISFLRLGQFCLLESNADRHWLGLRENAVKYLVGGSDPEAETCKKNDSWLFTSLR